jgi:hypothetical protein
MAFFANFYASFDYDSKAVTLAVNANAVGKPTILPVPAWPTVTPTAGVTVDLTSTSNKLSGSVSIGFNS